MTAPASVPALRIFAGTTEGRLLCEWASGAGIPARAYIAMSTANCTISSVLFFFI